MKESADTNRSLHRVTSACPGQWLYLLGDGGVLYSETQNRFAGLDAAGVFAYRAFDAGARIQDLKKFDDARSLTSASGEGIGTIYALSQGIFPAEDPPLDWPALDHPAIANIEIDGIPISLGYPAGPPLEHLCRDYFQDCPPTTQPARCRLDAQQAESRWAIHVNGRELITLSRDEQLGLGLLHAARSVLYAEGEYDVAFHAAMVADGDSGVMLCAPRESGKSTLAAYLMAQGFDLVTDEPTLLRLDTCSVSSLPLPVSLKEGSWAVLRDQWPQLASAPVHVRSDGTRIRLLHPPQARLYAPSRRLTHIVFPEYSPRAVVHAERLSPLRTLSFLNEGGMTLAKHFALDTCGVFLKFVSLTPAYTVRYDSLEDACRMILKLSAL